MRNGNNAMFLLAGGLVARVGGPGRRADARREVVVSRWLSEHGIASTRAVPDLPQPVVVDDRPVTWWFALPPHRSGTPSELGSVLRQLHALPQPDFALPVHDPFHGLDGLVGSGAALDDDDRHWLLTRIEQLRRSARHSADSRKAHLIHGDAWQGNLAVPEGGPPILLDFERVSVGNPARDLVQIAVDHTDFGRIDAAEYQGFVDEYGGVDVTSWAEYGLFASIQEVRWAAFAVRKAQCDDGAVDEARHRLACLRGRVPKPWKWNAF